MHQGELVLLSFLLFSTLFDSPFFRRYIFKPFVLYCYSPLKLLLWSVYLSFLWFQVCIVLDRNWWSCLLPFILVNKGLFFSLALEFHCLVGYVSGRKNSPGSKLMLWERFQVLWPCQITEDGSSWQWSILMCKMQSGRIRLKFQLIDSCC